MTFCNDVDLLYWEPDVIGEAAFASQALVTGTGDLAAGGVLTRTAGPTFTAQQVQPGNVAVLSGGAAAGCYAVTAVNGASEIVISVVHADLFPDDGASAPDPVGPAAATGVNFVIRTFYPQRKLVSDFLLTALGIVPGTAAGEVAAVTNPRALRRACALGTLQMIYSALAAAASEPAAFAIRADLYERLYRRALREAQVDLDLDGDGRADARRSPGLLRLVRE
jgi:hypothetical protein